MEGVIYLLKEILDRNTLVPKRKSFYSLIVDQEVQIHRISMDLPAILSFPKIDKHITTSTVEEIVYRDDGGLELVTLNTIYFLTREYSHLLQVGDESGI